MAHNPLLAPSTLPYQLPDFENLRPEHILPALRVGIEEAEAEIQNIVANPDEPTFENTLTALELSGQTLQRVTTYAFSMSTALGTEDFEQAMEQASPLVAEFRSALYLNKALFLRITAVADSAQASEFSPDQAHLLSELLRDFKLQGVLLGASEGARLTQINARLAELSAKFSQVATQNRQGAALLLKEAAQLEGLSDSEISAAAERANAHGHPGHYQLDLLSPTSQPALARLKNRDVRRRLLTASLRRGLDSEGTGGGTEQIIKEMAALRAEQATLLGFANHAEYKLAELSAPGLTEVLGMLTSIAPTALANAQREAGVMAEYAGHEIQPWDWAYYSDLVKREKFSLNEATLKPYFELNTVLEDGIFYAAGQLYGISFQEREDLHGYHLDVRVWEVFNQDGSPLGLFLGDYYARDTKKGGAWMNNLVRQSHLLDTKPVVMNNLNITKPAPGEPTLLSLDELRTAFHEFGHALHALFSDVYYPSQQGTSVPRDFVEYPSQVNEMWALWPHILENYAKHYDTAEPLAAELVHTIKAAALWGEGFATTEYLKATLLDLAWHQLGVDEIPEDLESFEQEALNAVGLEYEAVPPRYRSAYFAHIFGNDYSARYYSYIWSEVLEAETVEWFKDNGGLSRANGESMRAELLSRGNSRDPLESFRALRGRDAQVQPLLKKRGLA